VAINEQTRSELAALKRITGTIIVQITHHFDDVYLLADRIAIMCEGRIIQTGDPSDVHHHPADTVIAEFLCTGNRIRDRIKAAGLGRIVTGGQEFYAASDISGNVVAALHRGVSLFHADPLYRVRVIASLA
jgi:ABC-type proline/glycine betaine transport system ATPase subunit